MRKSLLFTVCCFVVLAACSTDPEWNKAPTTTTTLDATAPEVTIASPVDGEEVGGTYQFMGTVSDNSSGVQSVFVKTDDGDWTNAVLTGSDWSADISVSVYGLHTNYVYAADNAGNSSAEQMIVVERTSIPSISITSPANGYTATSSNITISGTASVDAPYELAGILVKLNEESWTLANGKTNWSIGLTLTSASNTVVARAITYDNKTNDTIEWTIYCSVFIVGSQVYVSSTGSDTGDGLGDDSPKATLDAGLALAQAIGADHLYVGGDFDLDSVWLITNLEDMAISGGWNSNFTAQDDISILSCAPGLEHVIFLSNCTGVSLSNFVLTGGNASYGGGGGLLMMRSESNIIDCIITNNSATTFGGGVSLRNSAWNTISGLLTGNDSTFYGGGIYLFYSSSNTVTAAISNNSSGMGGAAFLTGGYRNTLTGDINNNTASSNGGGVYLEDSHYNTIAGNVFNNTAITNGGGIYIYSCSHTTASGNVYGNAARYGAGMYIHYSGYITISGLVTNNTASVTAGGYYDHGSDWFTVTGGAVSGNTPNDVVSIP